MRHDLLLANYNPMNKSVHTKNTRNRKNIIGSGGIFCDPFIFITHSGHQAYRRPGFCDKGQKNKPHHATLVIRLIT